MGLQVKETPFDSIGEAIAVLLAVFYIKDLSYPSAYGQALGVCQEIMLGLTFSEKNGAAENLIKTFNN